MNSNQLKYSQIFEPIVKEGQTLQLYGSRMSPDGKGFKCVAIGALPEYVKDFGALSADTWGNDNEDTNLEMGPIELAQFRMQVLDDIKVRIKNPAAVQQWRTNRTNFYLPQFPQDAENNFRKEELWRMSEFFIFEDEDTPRFDLWSNAAATEARILFSGWRYKLIELKGLERGTQPIWINSWPSQAGR